MSTWDFYASTPMRGVGRETLRQQVCLRCDYRWWPRKVTRPIRCPACKSPYWHRLRQKTKPVHGATDSAVSGATGTRADRGGRPSFLAALDVMKAMKAEGKSWSEMADAIACRFGVRLEKDQLKALVR